MRDVSSSIVGGINTPMRNDVPLLSLDGSTSHVTMFKRYCCILNEFCPAMSYIWVLH